MTARELIRILKALGAVQVRQRGSHVRFQAGKWSTTVPVHKGEDLRPGTLAAIVRDLEPKLGPDWLRRYLDRR